jgi:pimeloyl-ACP methyl ester carboxylesterase
MQRLPNATLHVFAGAAHMPNAEAPAELAAVIDKFVRQGVVTAESLAAAAVAS